MSVINIPFPVDSIVLGENVVGPMFNPSSLVPNCFAQGILTKDGHLDPMVPAQVVKIEAGASLRVFALHGNFSVAGVVGLPAYPATALSATFSSDGRVSNAVFGNIEGINTTNQTIHALHGIRASFLNGKCTNVRIDDTHWMPWTPNDCTTILPDRQKPDETPSFHHDIGGNSYVRIRKFGKECHGHGSMGDHPDPGFIYKIILTSTKDMKDMIVQMPTGCDGKPSDAAVAQGKKFLLECDKILQSKMKAIQLLETHVQPSSLDNIFAWLNAFIQAQPRPQIQTMHSLSSNFARPTSLSIAGAPALAASAWGQLLHDAPYSPSDTLVRPCKCTPIEKDKQCKNEFCKFKLATDHSILLQYPLKQAILQRFDANRAKKERAEAEAVAKASQDAQAADNDRAAAAAKKLAKAAEKLTTQKEAAARRQEAMAKRATERNTVSAAAAAAAAAASKGKPAAAASKGKPAAAASAKSAAAASAKSAAAASAKPAAAASAKSAASASAKPVKSSITKKRKEGGSKSKSKRRLRK